MTNAPASPRDVVYRDLISGLYDGRFEPGQRITEAQLNSQFGYSRGPIREALNRLAAAGIVSLTPQRGAQVRVLQSAEAIDTLSVVRALIGLAARTAAERIGGSDSAERLAKALETIERYSHQSTGPEYARARDGFYARLVEASGNAELQRILPGVQIHLIRVQFRALMRETDSLRLSDYRRIVDAVLAGQAAAAEAAAKAHIDRSIRILRSVYEKP